MHLTPEEKNQVAKEVFLELAKVFDRNLFWKGLGSEMREYLTDKLNLEYLNNVGPEKPTTPTSGST
jgi:hypothetical protein